MPDTLRNPRWTDLRRRCDAALGDAHIAPTDMDYINAHGTGTLANDETETRAIQQLFGTHAEKLAISSTKSMHGHALGAAGALEAFATLMALSDGILPPTVKLLPKPIRTATST